MWIKVTNFLSNNSDNTILVNTDNVEYIFPARSIGYDGKTAIRFCGGKISENCIVVNESLKEIEAMISDGKNGDNHPEIMHWEQKVIHSEFKREQLEETVIYICDRCGQRSEKETNFCPNCGAKADWFCEKDGGRKMTNAEAIETLRANYPDACFEQLREAVDVAIKALKAQDIAGDTISRQWLLDCINDGWIKFDTDKDTNRFIHLVRDIAPPAQPEPKRRN